MTTVGDLVRRPVVGPGRTAPRREPGIVAGGVLATMLVLFLAQIPSLRHAASLDLARATKDLSD